MNSPTVLTHPLDPPSTSELVARGMRVTRLPGPPQAADGAVRTPHFVVQTRPTGVEVSHWIGPQRLDNDLAGLLADELLRPGLLPSTAAFEQVFTGIVRTAQDDPRTAWQLFYDNSLAKIRGHWQRPPVMPSTLGDMAPVYRRASLLVPPGSVLDLGSCFGFFPLLLADGGEHDVLASDVVAGSMRLLGTVAARRGSRLRTVVCDAASVPLPDRSVDTVSVLHLLEHLPPRHGRAVLSEALRLARRWVVVAVPFEDVPDPAYGHIRRFDETELRAMGAAAGTQFTVAEHHGGWLVLDAS